MFEILGVIFVPVVCLLLLALVQYDRENKALLAERSWFITQYNKDSQTIQELQHEYHQLFYKDFVLNEKQKLYDAMSKPRSNGKDASAY
jgi:hypothetical protein